MPNPTSESASIRFTWRALQPPPDPSTQSAARVGVTNAWVFKTFPGGFGLMLTGVAPPQTAPPFRNLKLSYKPDRIIRQLGREWNVTRCLEIELDPSCDPDVLATILDRLADAEPSGAFTTQSLITILKQVVELVRPPPLPPSKEAVIGVWGELRLLEMLIARAPSAESHARIVSGWESEGHPRDIIDFRYPSTGVAIEVKTSVAGRIHHLNGVDQVTMPQGFRAGLLASFLIRETDTGEGRTCADISRDICDRASTDHSKRSAAEGIFRRKQEARGREALDARFRFTDEGLSLLLFPMESVPRPLIPPRVNDVSWTADLSEIVSLSDSETERTLDEVAQST